MSARYLTSKDRFEHRPLYEELAEEFCRRITIGRWPVGRPLKTEANIATELGVSLGTVRRAFERLESFNLIDRTPGRGTVVLELDCKRRLACLTNVVDDEGHPVVGDIDIQNVSRVEADATVAKALGILEGAGLARIERTRCHDGQVFSVETAFLPLGHEKPLPTTEALWESARNFIVAGEIVVKRREYACATAYGKLPSATRYESLTEPLLEVHRTLLSFDETPLEYCLAYCQLGGGLRYRIC